MIIISIVIICLLIIGGIRIYIVGDAEPILKKSEEVKSEEVKSEEVKSEEVKSNCKYEDFDIQYMEANKKYYPRYKSKYMYLYTYGAWDLKDDLQGNADFFYIEEEAKKYIDRYMEFIGKLPSKIIKLC